VRRESNQQHEQALCILYIIPLIDFALPFSSYVPPLPTRTLDSRGRCTGRSSCGGSICRPRPPALNLTTQSTRNILLIPKLHSDARGDRFSSRAKDFCGAHFLSSSRAYADHTSRVQRRLRPSLPASEHRISRAFDRSPQNLWWRRASRDMPSSLPIKSLFFRELKKSQMPRKNCI
jgi:hypothetical protein